jgi:hypothetical protein
MRLDSPLGTHYQFTIYIFKEIQLYLQWSFISKITYQIYTLILMHIKVN